MVFVELLYRWTFAPYPKPPCLHAAVSLAVSLEPSAFTFGLERAAAAFAKPSTNATLLLKLFRFKTDESFFVGFCHAFASHRQPNRPATQTTKSFFLQTRVVQITVPSAYGWLLLLLLLLIIVVTSGIRTWSSIIKRCSRRKRGKRGKAAIRRRSKRNLRRRRVPHRTR